MMKTTQNSIIIKLLQTSLFALLFLNSIKFKSLLKKQLERLRRSKKIVRIAKKISD